MNTHNISSRNVVDAIGRLDQQLEAQTGRASMIQRLLDEQTRALRELFARLDASAARLEELLGSHGS